MTGERPPRRISGYHLDDEGREGGARGRGHTQHV